MELNNEYMRNRLVETTVAASGSPLFRFEFQLQEGEFYKNRRLVFVQSGIDYYVWYYCECGTEEKQYFSAPLKHINKEEELDLIINCFK